MKPTATPLKIAHIVEASFAGVGRHVLDLAAYQHRTGHDVLVAYSPQRESASFREERRELEAEGVRFDAVAMERLPGIGDVRALWRLRHAFGSFAPDIVHGHSTKGGLIARLVPTSAARVYTPNAVYSMNPQLSARARQAVGQLERLLARRTDCIIAVSPEEERHLHALGIDPERVILVPNGVQPAPATPKAEVRAALALPADAFIIGFVGRLDPQKAPEILLDAFEEVAPPRPDLHLAIVGDGQQQAEIAAAARSSTVSDRIHLLGVQPGQWAMQAFDLFALPSRYEGFPYVLIEAAQTGLPLLTTRGCAAKLLFEGEEPPGRVVDVDDIDAFTAALRGLLNDDLETLSRTARTAGHRFTAQRMGRETMDVLARMT